MAIAVEKPVAGVVKLVTSLLYGAPDNTEEGTAKAHARKSNPRMSEDDIV